MKRNLRPNETTRAALYPRITLNDLLRRWGKFDEAELAAMTSNADLVRQIQTKYGLDARQAQTNVDLWAKGREL